MRLRPARKRRLKQRLPFRHGRQRSRRTAALVAEKAGIFAAGKSQAGIRHRDQLAIAAGHGVEDRQAECLSPPLAASQPNPGRIEELDGDDIVRPEHRRRVLDRLDRGDADAASKPEQAHHYQRRTPTCFDQRFHANISRHSANFRCRVSSIAGLSRRSVYGGHFKEAVYPALTSPGGPEHCVWKTRPQPGRRALQASSGAWCAGFALDLPGQSMQPEGAASGWDGRRRAVAPGGGSAGLPHHPRALILNLAGRL